MNERETLFQRCCGSLQNREAIRLVVTDIEFRGGKGHSAVLPSTCALEVTADEKNAKLKDRNTQC
jgi:hypothetical protein